MMYNLSKRLYRIAMTAAILLSVVTAYGAGMPAVMIAGPTVLSGVEKAKKPNPKRTRAGLKRAPLATQDVQRQRIEVPGFVCNRPLAIRNVTGNAEEIGRYEKFELTFGLDATYDNPFDVEQVDVICHLRSPSGLVITIPAFFCQDYARSGDQGFKPKGEPAWKVRYTPVEVGRYEYFLTARDRNGETQSLPARLECVPSLSDGFIRVSRDQPFYFQFESGRSYVPIGINLPVSPRLGRPIPTDRLERCERYLCRTAKNGGNFARLRMDSWFMAIEMTPDEAAGHHGLGYYNQSACQEVDLIYDIAKQNGIYIMHCLDNANANVNLREPESKPWRRRYDLYLKEYGGVVDTHEEFWTNAEVARFVRNKLRYCVARWGYSTNCMCWEFWNEVVARKEIIGEIARWHRDMAGYLRETDPYDHPITTSIMGNSDMYKYVFSLPEMEIVQLHMYGRKDIPSEVHTWAREYTGAYRKPFFLGEFGTETTFSTCDFDDIGLYLHNGLWAPMMSGMSGPGALWYVEAYLDRKDLYGHFKPVAAFSRQVPWLDPSLRQATVSRPRLLREPLELHYLDFVIPTNKSWGTQKPPISRFIIDRDGRMENLEMIQPALYGSPRRQERPLFVLNPDRLSQFIIEVETSVGDETNILIVYLDGEKTIEKPFPAGKGLGKSSEYIEEYGNWRTKYDDEIRVAVPPGPHEIRLDMRGKDRLEVNYRLKDYVCFERSEPLLAMGLQTSDAAYLWIHNRSSTWYRKYLGQEPIGIEGAGVDVTGLKEGEYTVEWWDTWKGLCAPAETACCRDGKLVLSIPRVERDIACIVKKTERQQP